MSYYEISEDLLKITYKNNLPAKKSKYTFKVLADTNKVEIKKAVERIFNTKVDGVNIVNTKSKSRRRGKTVGKVSGFKKAIVTLKKGEKIKIREEKKEKKSSKQVNKETSKQGKDKTGVKTKIKKEEGIKRKIVGFEVVDKGIARSHYPVYIEGEKVSEVNSGTFSPYLKKSIGLTYLPVEYTEVGTEFEIGIRDRKIKAKVIPTPFYKRDEGS